MCLVIPKQRERNLGLIVPLWGDLWILDAVGIEKLIWDEGSDLYNLNTALVGLAYLSPKQAND